MNTMKLPTGEDVTHYIAAVRAELSDLPPDDLDDLTGGLEADLSEQVAESPSGLAGLGSAQAYAAELRSAAGFPARPQSADPAAPSWWSQQRALAATNLRDLREAHPWVVHVLDVAKDLRPAWWIVRGIMIAWLVGRAVNFGGLFFLLVVPAVIVSVVMGRRRNELTDWVRWAVVVGNVAAVLTLYGLAVSAMSSAGDYDTYPSPEQMYGPGLVFNGTSSSNLYVYDQDGKPLSGVRIFTDTGQPLDLSQNSSGADGQPLHGPVDIYGHAWDNTFPIVSGQPGDSMADPDAWTPPSAIPPLEAGSATTSPTPTPSPSSPTGDPSAAVTAPGGAATTKPTTAPAPRPTASLPTPAGTR